jgi:hypothetical protein
MITANFHRPTRAKVEDFTAHANPFVSLEIAADDGSRVSLFLRGDSLALAEAAAAAINAAIGAKP